MAVRFSATHYVLQHERSMDIVGVVVKRLGEEVKRWLSGVGGGVVTMTENMPIHHPGEKRRAENSNDFTLTPDFNKVCLHDPCEQPDKMMKNVCVYMTESLHSDVDRFFELSSENPLPC